MRIMRQSWRSVWLDVEEYLIFWVIVRGTDKLKNE